jgi:hypothetical protein
MNTIIHNTKNYLDLKNLINMKDTCIVCGVDTPYNLTENIHNRYFYVEGAGQLCKDCYDKTYS